MKPFGTLLDDVIGGDWGKERQDSSSSEQVSIIRELNLPSLSNGTDGSVPLRFTTQKKARRRMLQDGDIIIEVSGGSPTQPTGRSMLITRDILSRFPGVVVCASFCRRLRPCTWAKGIACRATSRLSRFDRKDVGLPASKYGNRELPDEALS